MSKNRFLNCYLDAQTELACICGAGSEHGSTQAVLLSRDGYMMALEGSGPWDARGFSLGDPTPVRVREPQQQAATGAGAQPKLMHGCWDAYSGYIYAAAGPSGTGIVQLAEDGSAVVVVGHLFDAGQRDSVWFAERFTYIVSDGEGCLYALDRGKLVRLQLPAAWRSRPAGGGAGAAAAACAAAPTGGNDPTPQQGQRQQQTGDRRDDSTAVGPQAAGEVRSMTLSCGAAIDRRLEHMAYDPASRSLVLCTVRAVYRLPVAGLGVDTVAEHEPQLVAGRAEEEDGHSTDSGAGTDVQFSGIWGVAVDGTGAAWVTDWLAPKLTRLVRVDPGGCVTTVLEKLPGRVYNDGSWTSLTVLRNGCLASLLSGGGKRSVMLLQLGLSLPGAGIGPSAGPCGTLAADLCALLDRQPDGSADVEVEVGGQVFAAHRGVLAARSPYFRQRLDPGAGFADGCTPRLSLPDADPAALGAVLRFMYTDSASPVPPELLQPVGELADRLLLPGLCAQVGRQLLGRVCLESVVGLLLWAEQRGGSYGALLAGLKEWFLRHHKPEEGRDLPDDDVVRLMREAPELGLQLLYRKRVG